MITIIAQFSVMADKKQQFINSAIKVTKETRKERGCLSYKILESQKTPNSFTFIEEWLNDTAIEQHNNSKHFASFLEEINSIITEEIKIERYTKVPSIFF